MPPPAPALFARLFDDAALFPPAALPMGEAVAQHRSLLAGWTAPLLGPFVCPQARLAELDEAAGPAGAGLQVSVVVTAGTGLPGEIEGAIEAAIEGAERAAHLELVSLEVPLGAPESCAVTAEALVAEARRAGLGEGGPAVFAEVPWQAGEALDDVVGLLATAGLRAKLRTGGLSAAAFPGEADVARFIATACRHDVAFKCTAGLHEAVRRRGRTGFEQMGFANLLLATAAAAAGAGVDELARLLSERDEAVVAAALPAVAPAVRDAFTSFGTCSVLEPVEDLVRLGLLVPPHARLEAGAG